MRRTSAEEKRKAAGAIRICDRCAETLKWTLRLMPEKAGMDTCAICKHKSWCGSYIVEARKNER